MSRDVLLRKERRSSVPSARKERYSSIRLMESGADRQPAAVPHSERQTLSVFANPAVNLYIVSKYNSMLSYKFVIPCVIRQHPSLPNLASSPPNRRCAQLLGTLPMASSHYPSQRPRCLPQFACTRIPCPPSGLIPPVLRTRSQGFRLPKS